MSIVLASASKSRAHLLQVAGVNFQIEPAQIDEDEIKRRTLGRGAPAAAVALELAARKACAVSTNHPGDVVIGGDQILWFEGELISKCANLEEARTLLSRLKGRRHSLVGGLTLARNGTVDWRHSSRVEMTIRSFSEAFLDGYLRREGRAALDSVGAYRLEGEGIQLIESIEGSYFSVLGLDLLPLLAALRAAGAIPG